jgi:hypothetical protein
MIMAYLVQYREADEWQTLPEAFGTYADACIADRVVKALLDCETEIVGDHDAREAETSEEEWEPPEVSYYTVFSPGIPADPGPAANREQPEEEAGYPLV